MHTISVKCEHLPPPCVALKRTTGARFRDAGQKSSSTSLTSAARPLPLPCDAHSPPPAGPGVRRRRRRTRGMNARGGRRATLAPTSAALPLPLPCDVQKGTHSVCVKACAWGMLWNFFCGLRRHGGHGLIYFGRIYFGCGSI